MIRRIFYALTFVLLVSLYFGASDLKYKTLTAKEELQRVEIAIARERDEIRVLKAEWSHLTRPDNLRKLSDEFLALENVRVEQIAAMEDVPYLGVNIFDKTEGAMPINFEPRSKPSRGSLDPAPAQSPFESPIRVAQIELVTK